MIMIELKTNSRNQRVQLTVVTSWANSVQEAPQRMQSYKARHGIFCRLASEVQPFPTRSTSDPDRQEVEKTHCPTKTFHHQIPLTVWNTKIILNYANSLQ